MKVPGGFDAGALDFASSLLAWVIFHLTHSFKIVGPLILSAIALGMMYFNRRMILKDNQEAVEISEADDIDNIQKA